MQIHVVVIGEAGNEPQTKTFRDAESIFHIIGDVVAADEVESIAPEPAGKGSDPATTLPFVQSLFVTR